jgi:hypothetical protein
MIVKVSGRPSARNMGGGLLIMQKWIITGSLVLILASPGLACAESWVLWEREYWQRGEMMIRNHAVGIHETKRACLAAANDHVKEMFENRIRAERERFGRTTKAEDGSGYKGFKVVEEASTREPRSLKNVHGYGTILRTSVLHAECWPVRVTPQ